MTVVVIIGAPGAGKTRIGRRVAKLLGVPFVDTDKRIVASHGPIAEIFTHYGEPYFRTVERAAVAAALSEDAVVTLGAGAVLDSSTQQALAGHRIMQLSVRAEAVEKRIAGGKRPLLAGGIAAWQSLVDARQPIYDRLSHHTIDTSNRSLSAIAVEIVDWLREGTA